MAADSYWTMTKMLHKKEMELQILQLDDEELEVQKNLFQFWDPKNVEKVMLDTQNGVKITLFDMKSKEAMKTTMKRVAGEEFHVQWDFTSKGYVVGDEILMRWDSKNKRLCYKVEPISALRTYPEIAEKFSSSFYPVEQIVLYCDC